MEIHHPRESKRVSDLLDFREVCNRILPMTLSSGRGGTMMTWGDTSLVLCDICHKYKMGHWGKELSVWRGRKEKKGS